MSKGKAIAFVEQRTYLLKPGCLPDYLRTYEADGLAVQLATLEHLVGYYSVDVGTINTVVHLWAFESHDERDARRARMASHPAWKSYWAKVRPLVQTQQSVILKPAPFFAGRLASMLGAATLSTPASPSPAIA